VKCGNDKYQTQRQTDRQSHKSSTSTPGLHSTQKYILRDEQAVSFARYFLTTYISTGMGTIFCLGEQKSNDFSVGEAKIGEKQSRQSKSKHNFMQYAFFEKVYAVYNGLWGKAGEFLRNFCVKSNHTVCIQVTFNCKLQKNWGSRMY